MKTIIIAVSAINGIISKDTYSSVDWSSKVDKKHFKKVTTGAGVVIMGRKTFETMGKPLPNRLNVVMTRNPEKYIEEQQLVFTSKSPSEILAWLDEKGYETVMITGGSEIYTLFLNEGLVDEIMLTIEPLLLKGNVNFLKNLKEDISLKLLGVEKLNENTLLVIYKVLI